jgi:hypothetical protein
MPLALCIEFTVCAHKDVSVHATLLPTTPVNHGRLLGHVLVLGRVADTLQCPPNNVLKNHAHVCGPHAAKTARVDICGQC